MRILLFEERSLIRSNFYKFCLFMWSEEKNWVILTESSNIDINWKEKSCQTLHLKVYWYNKLMPTWRRPSFIVAPHPPREKEAEEKSFVFHRRLWPKRSITTEFSLQLWVSSRTGEPLSCLSYWSKLSNTTVRKLSRISDKLAIMRSISWWAELWGRNKKNWNLRSVKESFA